MNCPRCGALADDNSQACPSCGLSLIPVGAVLAGDVAEADLVRQALAADCEIVEELGRGGMAVVYRARERQLRRDVAVKVLPLAMGFDAEFVERFLQEARTAAQLEHPNIIPIYRVGQQGRVTYFVMKYLRGQSLAALLRHRGKLPPQEIRNLLIEVGDALSYAARQGVVHRDSKPDNIMFDEHGHAVVTDFGIAKAVAGPSITGTGKTIGTPQYMSPEQARAQPLDGRSDIYSLGIVAYQCLAGRVPFDGEDSIAVAMQHVTAPLPKPPLATLEERELFALIEHMTAKHPDERIQNAEELARVLRGEPVGPRTSVRAAKTEVRASVQPTVPIAPDAIATETAKAEAAVHLRQLKTQSSRAAYVLASGGAKLGLVLLERSSQAVRWTAANTPKAWALLRAGSATALQWAVAKGTRFWIVAAAVGVLAVGAGYYVPNFLIEHRSRCPEPATGFGLLVDPIGSVRQDSDVELYYDVCGLEAGTDFKTQVVITKIQSGLRQMLGGGPTIRLSYDERARGPVVRRHRSLEIGRVDPGSYKLALSVTDNKGRRRDRTHEFIVIGR